MTEDATLLALKMQEGLWAKEYGQPLGAGKGMETDPSPESEKECSPANTLIAALRDPKADNPAKRCLDPGGRSYNKRMIL